MTSGWQGGISNNGQRVLYNTQSKITDDQNNELLLDIRFIETDTPFIFFSEDKAMELLSPRKISMSDFPNFYFRIVCKFDGKSYSNVVYDFGDIFISDDFELTIDDLDLEFSHDCLDGAKNLILSGNFSGPLINQSDSSENIFVDNGDFKYMFLRY